MVTDRRKPKYWEKNMCQCHFVYHKSHMRWSSIRRDQQMHTLYINMYLFMISLLHVSVVKPPSSGGIKGHKHRFASNSHVLLHL
jgi:hypothetical protein